MPGKNRINLKDNQLYLTELIDIKEWKKILDNFATVTGICVRLVDPKGEIITTPNKQPRLCTELLKEKFPSKDGVCRLCLPTFLGGSAVVDKNLSFSCVAVGLDGFLAPLKLDNRVLGYIIVGPVILVMRKQKEQYLSVAQKLGIDLEDFWSAILEVKVISFHGAQSVLELIKELVENSIRLAYLSKARERELAIKSDSAKLSKFFDALLDVALEISRAGVGSVMSLDEAKNELKIEASKGIAGDIVRKARVKLGSGISGIAAKEGESLLLDENTEDNRIKPYLNRPNISSSMVIPLKVKNRVVGVMNMGALDTSDVKFDNDSMDSMKRLVNLVSLAAIQT